MRVLLLQSAPNVGPSSVSNDGIQGAGRATDMAVTVAAVLRWRPVRGTDRSLLQGHDRGRPRLVRWVGFHESAVGGPAGQWSYHCSEKAWRKATADGQLITACLALKARTKSKDEGLDESGPLHSLFSELM